MFSMVSSVGSMLRRYEQREASLSWYAFVVDAESCPLEENLLQKFGACVPMCFANIWGKKIENLKDSLFTKYFGNWWNVCIQLKIAAIG